MQWECRGGPLSTLRSAAAVAAMLAVLALTFVSSPAESANPGFKAVAITRGAGVKPGASVTLVARVRNPGDRALSIAGRLELPQGWSVVVPFSDEHLEAEQSRTMMAVVHVPPGAAAGKTLVRAFFASKNGDPEVGVSFTLTVEAVAAVAVKRLSAPVFVAATSFDVRFTVANTGNIPSSIRFSTYDSMRYDLDISPSEVLLDPGRSVPVTVRVSVPKELNRSVEEVVHLRAVREGAPKANDEAEASVRVVPTKLRLRDAYHLFPLRVQGVWSHTEKESGFHWNVAGSGRITEGDPGWMQLDIGDKQQLVRYSRSDWQLYAGDQRFTLSPLTQYGEKGSGIAAGATRGPLRLVAQTMRDAGGTPKHGGRLRYRLSKVHDVAINTLVSPVDHQRVVSLETSLFRTSPLQVDLEYGRRFGGIETAPFAWRGRSVLASDTFVGVAGVQVMSAGYQRGAGAQKRASLEGHADLSKQMRIGLGWSGEREEDAAVRRDTSFVNFDGVARQIPWRIGWRSTRRQVAGAGPDRVHNQLHAFATRDVTNRTRLSYRTLLDFARDGASTEVEMTNEGTYDLYLDTGNLELTARWEQSFVPDREKNWGVGGAWHSNGLGPFRWSLSGRLPDVRRPDRIEIRGKGVYADTSGKIYQLGGVWTGGGSGEYGVYTSVSVPFDVPVHRRSNVGDIAGSVVDDDGFGIPNLVVSVAGESVATDEEGRFRFPAIPAGTVFVVILPDQLGPDRVTLPQTPWRVTIDPGQSVRKTFHVFNASHVKGRLRFTTADNDGVGGRAVFGEGGVAQRSGGAGEVTVTLSNGDRRYQRRSDPDGEFSFDHLVPGKWELTVDLGDLEGAYRARLSQRVVDLGAGEEKYVAIDLVPVVRRIKFLQDEPVELEETGE